MATGRENSPNSMNRLRKFVAPEFMFGNGSRNLAGRYIQNLGGSRVLLVTDKGVSDAGWSTSVEEQMKAQGLFVAKFTGLTPNPKAYEVKDGLECYRDNSCDCIVAVGGGSVMDCAKGIGVVAANGGEILSYIGVDTVSEPGPPLLCIPTTSGSAADVSQFAIIADSSRKVKLAIVSKAIVPDVALIDPEMTSTMPDYLTACTGIDALTHAVEAYVSNGNSPFTDLHALKAIELVFRNLPSAVKNPQDLQVREQMSLACLEAGLAFSNASLGAVHAMAHSLGGYMDLPHGECNALLLEQVVDYNYQSTPERFLHIAEAAGLETRGLNASEILPLFENAIHKLKDSVGIKRRLGDLGVSNRETGNLARNAEADPCLVTNPRPARQTDLERIYEAAM